MTIKELREKPVTHELEPVLIEICERLERIANSLKALENASIDEGDLTVRVIEGGRR